MNLYTHPKFSKKPLAKALAISLGAALCFVGQSASAQDERPQNSLSSLLEEVVVTARKREESIYDVPLSVSAFGSDQLEALKVRDLTNLAVGLPNVAMDEIGTTRGTANFSIRGLGVNSSIPSIDPTVGVFVDGVYMGLNSGIIFDMFDVESVEVLRGPQGILFGRNVTGGAVLINTKKPTEEFEASFRAAIDGGGDGGTNIFGMASISGPLGENAGGKLSVYTNQDDGWFENQFDGSDHGGADTIMFRPVITWAPTDSLELIFRYEYLETDSDGPAAQSHTNGFGVDGQIVNFDRDSFDFSVDETGFQETEANFFTMQGDLDVQFGEGTFTYILGWRDYEAESLSDIDASPGFLFHAPAFVQDEQWSHELRYAGRFGDATVTTGFYRFEKDQEYHERRLLLGGALQQDGGGEYDVETTGLFLSVDYDVSDLLTLTFGGRQTWEEKDAKIASLIFNVNNECNVTLGTCAFDFVDDEDWSNFSPKIGFNYAATDSTNVYGHWTKGFRSGGYNLRNTSGDVVNNGPGPFEEEEVTNFELGFRSNLGSRGRISGAVFYNDIKDMQREVNLSDPVSGVVQIIKNTADAEIFGIEVDGTFALSDNLVLMSSIGWIDSSYTDVAFDLNGDGVVNDADEDLDLPRAADLTFSIGLTYDVEIGTWGNMAARVSFAHRDESAYTDNNRGFITEQDILDAGLDFYSNDGRWTYSLYGRNLTDEVKHGGDTQLPSLLGPVPLGGTFSPLARGRVFGAEVTFNYF